MHTYIILDDLNECTGTEQSHIVGFVETPVRWGFDNLHLLVTSQKQPEERCLILELQSTRSCDDTYSSRNTSVSAHNPHTP